MAHERTPLLQQHPANEEKKRDADDKKADACINDFVSSLEKRRADDLKEELRNLQKQRLDEQKTWADAQLSKAKRTPTRTLTFIDVVIPLAIALSEYGTYHDVSHFLRLNKMIRKECLNTTIFANCRIRAMDFQLLIILAKKSGLIFKYQEDIKALAPLARIHEPHLTADEKRRYDTFAGYEEKICHIVSKNHVGSILHLGVLRTRTHVAPATELIADCSFHLSLCTTNAALLICLLLFIISLIILFKYGLSSEQSDRFSSIAQKIFNVDLDLFYISLISCLVSISCTMLTYCLTETSDTLLVRRANALIEDSKKTSKEFLSSKVPTLKDTLKQYFKHRLTFFKIVEKHPPAMLTQTKELLERSMCIFDDKEPDDTLENRNIKAMLNGYGIFREQTVQIEVLPDAKDQPTQTGISNILRENYCDSHANTAATTAARPADGKPEVADGKVEAADNRAKLPPP